MALSFVQFSDNYTNSGTSLSMSVPSGAAAGDVLIAVVTFVSGARTSASATDFGGNNKWTYLSTTSSSSQTWYYWRIMQSGDTSWTYSTTSAGPIKGTIVAYTDTSPKWYTSLFAQADSTAATASATVTVASGLAIAISSAYRSSSMTGISMNLGTSRVASTSTQIAHAIYDDTTGGVFTSTTTGSTPTDHFIAGMRLSSAESSDFYDLVKIDSSNTDTGWIYKGRDTAADDTTGVV
jgi:hypothetical protein